jgi:hypothetical protein
MSKQPTQLSQTGQDPDTYCGLLYSAEYQYCGQTRCDDYGDYLTKDAAHTALAEMIGRLSNNERRYVFKPCVCETAWLNGMGVGTKSWEIDPETLEYI